MDIHGSRLMAQNDAGHELEQNWMDWLTNVGILPMMASSHPPATTVEFWERSEVNLKEYNRQLELFCDDWAQQYGLVLFLPFVNVNKLIIGQHFFGTEYKGLRRFPEDPFLPRPQPVHGNVYGRSPALRFSTLHGYVVKHEPDPEAFERIFRDGVCATLQNERRAPTISFDSADQETPQTIRILTGNEIPAKFRAMRMQPCTVDNERNFTVCGKVLKARDRAKDAASEARALEVKTQFTPINWKPPHTQGDHISTEQAVMSPGQTLQSRNVDVQAKRPRRKSLLPERLFRRIVERGRSERPIVPRQPPASPEEPSQMDQDARMNPTSATHVALKKAVNGGINHRYNGDGRRQGL